ncbi:MAG TPA: nucleotidyltransferase family protein [Afifellaceae bacterium]|nr:nucleotidyltransferase family protein [Afifellaceae bacterium]
MRIATGRQTAVETVIALMRASVGEARAAESLPPGPPWAKVIEVASAGLVLSALASGARALPGGLGALGEAGGFLAAMEAANAARNERLMQRLGEAVAALAAAGIPAVALKGAVFALEDPAQAPWRFLGDLDLLIPTERMQDAVAAFAPLSYHAGGEPDLGDELHHFPPLLHADGETVLELHSRLFPTAGNALLPPERLLAHAQPLEHVAGLFVPVAVDRMVHLIAHAQIANRRFERRTLSLRDALDFVHLMRRGDIHLDSVLDRFEAHGHGPAAAGFLLAMNRLIGGPPPLPRSTRAAAHWSDAAIASLRSPARLRWRVAWDSLRDHAARLMRHESRRRAWTGLRDPVRRRHVLQRALFGWRNTR